MARSEDVAGADSGRRAAVLGCQRRVGIDALELDWFERKGRLLTTVIDWFINSNRCRVVFTGRKMFSRKWLVILLTIWALSEM